MFNDHHKNMNIEIELIRPMFKCEADESIFFQRLAEMKNLKKIVAKEHSLYLSFSDQEMNIIIDEIQTISNIWNTEFKIAS